MTVQLKDGDVPIRGNPDGKVIGPEKPSDVGSKYQPPMKEYDRRPRDEKGPGCGPDYTGWIG